MLDPQLLRADPESVAAALAPRGYTLDVATWRELETRRKDLQVRVQDLQNQKNQSAKAVGMAKGRGEDIQPLLDEIKHLGEELGQVESEFSAFCYSLRSLSRRMSSKSCASMSAASSSRLAVSGARRRVRASSFSSRSSSRCAKSTCVRSSTMCRRRM